MASREKTRETVLVMRQLSKTMQRFLVDQWKTIWLRVSVNIMNFGNDISGKKAYIHAA